MENWSDSSHILYVTENKPGVLHEIAKLLKELEINIVKASGGPNCLDYSNANICSLTIELSSKVNIEKLKQRLSYDYHAAKTEILSDGSQKVSLKFKCQPTPNSNTKNDWESKLLAISGNDRIGLLADKTKPIFEENIDISSFSAESINGNGKFNMNFSLIGPPGTDWESILEKIKTLEGSEDDDLVAWFN